MKIYLRRLRVEKLGARLGKLRDLDVYLVRAFNKLHL